MSDYDPVAEAEANLAVVTLERELRELKDGGDPEDLRQVKHDLREARQRYREMRETAVPDGDAVVAPETVTAKASTGKAGD